MDSSCVQGQRRDTRKGAAAVSEGSDDARRRGRAELRLTLRRVLEPTVHNRAEDLWLEKKVSEARARRMRQWGQTAKLRVSA
jgi:hypothetical protein